MGVFHFTVGLLVSTANEVRHQPASVELVETDFQLKWNAPISNPKPFRAEKL
jgi:hypothetical protein